MSKIYTDEDGIEFTIVEKINVPLDSRYTGKYGFSILPRTHLFNEFNAPLNSDDFYHNSSAKAGPGGLVNTTLNRRDELIAAYCPTSTEGDDLVYYYHAPVLDTGLR